jgi:hypothetical protein
MRLISEIFELPGSPILKMDILVRQAIRELSLGYTKRFENSNQYWKNVYKWGGNSGKGSRGDLAAEKADFVNAFCRAHDIDTVVEFGSGDGVCASMIEVERYIGFDISDTALKFARSRCQNQDTHRLFNYDKWTLEQIRSKVSENKLSDNILNLSMDVMYHLVEDKVLNQYIDCLCKTPSKYVAVFSTDPGVDGSAARHVRQRAYSPILLSKYGLRLVQAQPLKSDHDHADGGRPFKVFSR